MTYLTAIERTHDNPLTGKAAYRVKETRIYPNKVSWKMMKTYGIWRLATSQPYRKGTFIDPRKALGIPKL